MSAALAHGTFDTIANLLKLRCGLAIGQDKLHLLDTRLAPILKRHGLRDLNALAEPLKVARTEPPTQEVVEAMTTNESLFFRDDTPFEHVRTPALPRLHAARPPRAPIRIWSAASSSGQEAYSLAMILTDMHVSLGDRRVEVVGTDIARDQLARAHEGIYSQFELQHGLAKQMLVKHFRKEGARWRVAEAIRRMVDFRGWNRLADLRPLGRFDLVFCRDVLIDFDQPTEARVLEAIASLLAPDRLLYLGGAETVLRITSRLAPLAGARRVYGLASVAAAVA